MSIDNNPAVPITKPCEGLYLVKYHGWQKVSSPLYVNAYDINTDGCLRGRSLGLVRLTEERHSSNVPSEYVIYSYF